MAYVSVPKDLTQVKPKFLFNLTKRQVICFGGGAALGLPLFFLTRNVIGSTPASLLMMLVMLPCFMFGVYEKNGVPLEKLLGYYMLFRWMATGSSAISFCQDRQSEGSVIRFALSISCL